MPQLFSRSLITLNNLHLIFLDGQRFAGAEFGWRPHDERPFLLWIVQRTPRAVLSVTQALGTDRARVVFNRNLKGPRENLLNESFVLGGVVGGHGAGRGVEEERREWGAYRR